MKFYTSIPKTLKPFYELELINYKNEYSKENFKQAWIHLERAHVLGQKYPYAHTFVHLKMLEFGFKIKDRKEVLGQIPRLIFGGIKSFVGKIPVGNTGGANVHPLKPLPIEKELQEIFVKAEINI